jgi:Na+-transporting NADH:ubiquinone oxidoreductase subunit B
MQRLRQLLDRVAPHFERGGRFEKIHPAFESVDTLLYSPGTTTRTASHVRDGLDLKRMMSMVIVALLPCVLAALYNTGLQAHLAISQGASPLDDWQSALFTALGGSFDPKSPLSCCLLGALYFLPVLLVCYGVGLGIEIASASLRGHEVSEGFLVTGMLIPLTLPPTIPLWQVGLGTAFGVIFGKEVFGGTGMNFLNPALVARAFIFFAYPADISGDAPWIAADFLDVDSFTGATLLAQAAAGCPAPWARPRRSAACSEPGC